MDISMTGQKTIQRPIISTPIGREIGAHFHQGTGTRFTVWAPAAESVEVAIEGGDEAIGLQKDAAGYWTGNSAEVRAGARYWYVLNGAKKLPDPASLSQPEGVHKASEVIDHSTFQWTDRDWKGLEMKDLIIYELHIGTFTEAGTFDAAIERIQELLDLGITAIEIMPIAQFAGDRNWGYDGVFPFAVQNSYGGAEGFKRLVNALHEAGLEVILDVVYNHFGPEGNYTNEFGPYFTGKNRTPWGTSLNFDDEHSDHVRNFFIQNALMWLRDLHVDALRLDAVHAILDTGAKHFLQELVEKVRQLSANTGRKYLLIAESDLSDRRLIDPIEKGGYGLDGQWMDDLHHAIHTRLTGETDGYYMDFSRPDHLVKALRNSFVYNGTYSEYRKRTVGNDATDSPSSQFVVCIQNHDQVGNRMLGERLTQLVPFDMLKVAAGIYLLSPYVPMLFMGEEYGEESPFLYFVSHTDGELVEAVRKGRREEFASFAWKGEAPDPQSAETFLRSKLQRTYERNGNQRALREFYKELIRIRRNEPAMIAAGKRHLEASLSNGDKVLHMVHSGADPQLYALFNMSGEVQEITLLKMGGWNILLDSADHRWGGDRSTGSAPIGPGAQFKLPPSTMIVLKSIAD